MAQQIKDATEVSLNSALYKIKSKVLAQYVPKLPAKVNTGPDSFDNEQYLSNWIIGDQRGGLGKEEMDESVDFDRYWWGNCITDYNNHLLLPRLATAISILSFPGKITDPGLETWSDANTLTNWTFALVQGTPTLNREGTTIDSGTYSAKIILPVNQDSATLVQTFTTANGKWNANYQSKTVTVNLKGKVTDAAAFWKVKIADNLGNTESAGFNDTAAFTSHGVTHTINAAATSLTITITAYSSGAGGSTTVYLDSISTDIPYAGTFKQFENFNSIKYIATGNCLMKMNTGRTAYTFVKSFETAPAGDPDTLITKIIASLNSCLYIFLGDSLSYQYMSTAESFTVAVGSNGGGGGTSSAATYAFQWDNKLFKMTSAGVCTYSATPNSATPTWTAGGDITDIASQIESFFIGKDAGGDDVPYCATNSKQKVLDFANTKWIEANVSLPDHPNGGKGACYFNSAHYFSYGQGVKKYVTGSTATITEVGLNKNDGIPIEFNGEFVKLYGDSGGYEMFGLLDASQVSGTSRSGLYAHDGRGWKCWWVPPAVLIEDCEDVWLAGTGNMTVTLDSSDFQVGAASVNIAVAAGASAADLMAAENITAIDLSGCNYVSFRFKSTVDLTAADLALLLDDTANCASPIEVISLPAITANTWTKVNIALATPSSDTAIVSVGLRMVVDKGAFSVKIDQIEGYYYDGIMHDVIVSSASSSYAVYFDHAGTVYYIDIPRGLANPSQLLSTQKYMAAGIHISPWFDAGTSAYKKLTKRLTDYAKNITTTETIALKYRLDRTYIDLDTGWTTMETLNTTGESGQNEEIFASGAGSTNNAIQLRFDLVRGSTNTLSPDLQAVVLAYKLVTGGKWMWAFTILIDDSYHTIPEQKVTALKTAIESETFIPFRFRIDADGTTETHYVQILSPREITASGDSFEGELTLQAVEL